MSRATGERVTAGERARATLRKFTPEPVGWFAAALIAVGALIRLALLLAGWPATDADEGTMGLMSLHIANKGEWPLFFYGQSYMGTIQAYLGALMFHIFGVSVLSLRLGLLLLYILYLVVMSLLLRTLYDGAFALVGLALLDLGGPDLLRPQLLALGGYPETLLFGALALLLAVRLALTSGAQTDAPGWRRLARFGVFGLTLGVAWWSDQLVFPFLLVAVALLVVFCHHELRWRGALAVVTGLIVGVLPQLIFLTQPHEDGPSAVAAFEWQGMSTITRLPGQFVGRILGTLLVSLPNITGAGWVCKAPTLPNGALATPSSGAALACLGLRGMWSVALLTLGVVATLLVWQALRAYPPLRQAERWTVEQRASGVRLFGRLMLLLGAGLTLAFYLVSLAAATPAGNARYLIELNIALPAMVYPLWVASGGTRVSAAIVAFLSSRLLPARRAGLALLLLVSLCGVVAAFQASAAMRARAQADQVFIHDLERLGVRHMHSEYWTCYRIIFLSQERITCDARKPTLVEGFNRYPPYIAEVAADPNAPYVFPATSSHARTMARLAQNPTWPYTLIRMDGYVVYVRK